MVLLLTVPALLLAGGDDKSAPFTITISGPNQPVEEGAEVRIHVVLTNVSGRPVSVQRSPSPELAEFYYTVRVRDEHGPEAKMTDYGRAASKGQYQGSQMLILLRPGEEDEENTVLSKQFDMSAPGTYTIQLERAISRDPKDGSFMAVKSAHEPKDGIVKSNQITITLVPR